MKVSQADGVDSASYPRAVFRRNQTTVPTDAATDDDAPVVGKGAPHPQAPRCRGSPQDRAEDPVRPKAAKKAMRDRDRIERAQQREAMMRGDERALPARDQGLVRAFVRQWVDSRRLISEFFLPIVLVILVLTLIPNQQLRLVASLTWYLIMVLMIGVLAWIGWRLRRDLVAKFPEKSDRRAPSSTGSCGRCRSGACGCRCRRSRPAASRSNRRTRG